jgi:hypothetical protein
MKPPPLAVVRPRNGHRVVALIFALLSLPFVVATLLWQFGWQPGRQINHGQLLATSGRPVLQIHESDLLRRDFRRSPASDSGSPGGDSLALSQDDSRRLSEGDSTRSSDGDSLRSQKIAGNAALATAAPAETAILGHWLLALVVPDQCTADCLAQLHLARQVQVSLNKDMVRLRRALIGPQLDDPEVLSEAMQRWPDLLIARPSAAGWQTLGADVSAPQLVLIDPQGVLVLRYPPSPDPRGLRRDVERLLKYSWLG